MAKSMPVGTIRKWENGDYIKAHEGSIFSSGWIPLSTNAEIEKVARDCDSMAARMIYQKLPINGEKFLDHEIGEFEKEEHAQFGKYTPDDFKQYFGFEGAARYSFRNEFSRRFMKPKIDIKGRINNTLLEANEEEAMKQGRQSKDICLTKEAIDKIKTRIKTQYKEDPTYFTIKEAEELRNIIKRTQEQLDAGLNFEGDQKEIYDKAVTVANSLALSYSRLKVKKEEKNKAIESIRKAFSDNWGVQNGFETYIDAEYNKYLEKYKKRIIEDEADDQGSVFGVKLDADSNDFYPALYKKLEKDPDKYPFQELIDVRFAAKYGKELKGDWTPNMLPAIEMIEKMIETVPSGHFLTNSNLVSITQKDYSGGDHGGYAWYSPEERRINLSKSMVQSGLSIWSRLTHSNEFESTIAHEVGHAVSQKFGRDDTMAYKEFAVACGWSYSQQHLRSGMKATGGQRSIPREGSNSHIQLLTKYAHKSQEEAFAEYYSIYYLHRDVIDKWLDTGDSSHLAKSSITTSEAKHSEYPISFSLERKMMDTKKMEEVNRVVRNLHLKPDEHIKLELISPWEATIHASDRGNYSPTLISVRKDRAHESMPVTVAIRDNNRFEILDGVNRHTQAKLNKRMLPSVNITKELYTQLSSQGYSDKDIIRYALTTKKDEHTLYQSSGPRKEQGLTYDNKILPVEQIKQSHNIFKKMRAIFHSDDLKKAFISLGFN